MNIDILRKQRRRPDVAARAVGSLDDPGRRQGPGMYIQLFWQATLMSAQAKARKNEATCSQEPRAAGGRQATQTARPRLFRTQGRQHRFADLPLLFLCYHDVLTCPCSLPAPATSSPPLN